MRQLLKRIKPRTVLAIVFVHVVAGYGIYRLHEGYSSAAWWAFGLTWAANVLSITVVNHRYMTHLAFKVKSALLEKIMYAMPTGAFQGDGIWWGETHWRHHVHEDAPGDPHRPAEFGGGLKGFLWAHVGWMLFELAPAPSPNYRPSSHFRQSAGLRWQKKYYLPLGLAFCFGIPYLIAGWDGLLLAGFVRLALCWNISWSVNSFCHAIGGHAKDSAGKIIETRQARNFPLHCLLNILAILSGGEFWHANHHARPRSAYMGWYWHQIDPGGIVVTLGEKVGLFTDVRPAEI